MKVILFMIALITLSAQTFGQKANVIGEWKFGKGFSLYHYYNFDSLGIVKFSISGCTGKTLSIGNYCIKEDSIIINYYPGYYEYINGDVEIYRTDSSKLEWDTLFILDRHNMQVDEYIFINNFDLPDIFNFGDSLFCTDQYNATKEILFDSINDNIMERSFPILDSLLLFLTLNKNITIEIERWGEKAISKDVAMLSQIQVELIGEYLVRNGINPIRLTFFGNEQFSNEILVGESCALKEIFEKIFDAIRQGLENEYERRITLFRITSIYFKEN
ncbi:MAG: hypothetical protein IPK88_10795 [Saprospiraceae bacterium]|nr:hypothetical protein [Candidatus Defluviibacterium haderslevense]